MNTNSTFIQRYSLPIYLILTPLISLAIALFLPIPILAIALLLLLVPSTLAILLTALTEGGKGVSELLKKLFQWRISSKWYIVALAMPIGIVFASGVLAFLLGWSPSVQIRLPAASLLITNIILVLLIAVLEELGWRGYALPRLLEVQSPFTSALIVGMLWGLLHIGLGLADGRPWLPTFLAPFGMSITLTWLFLHTRGSLAMAMLFHFAVDYAPQFILSGLTIAQAVWSQAIVNLAMALVLILLFGVNLQRGPVKEPALADAGQASK